jgi:NDP-sugar pyrophosphorylase family protein
LSLSEETTLQIVMPMGGLGQRFRAVGVTVPKPLIEVDGEPMFRKALHSFSASPWKMKLISVIRVEDDNEFGIGAEIEKAWEGAEIIRMSGSTRGAVETALKAEPVLNRDQPLVILDCDIAFKSNEYFQMIENAMAVGSEGVLLSFASRDPRYSYAKADGSGRVSMTAEKNPISSNALMGAYFFSRAATFFDAAHVLIAQQLSTAMPEFYVSLIFNILIAEGKRIDLATGDFYCFGTPEELADYERTGAPVGLC